MTRNKTFQAKHITDAQVLRAYVMANTECVGTGTARVIVWPSDILMRDLGCPEKVAYAAMWRADKRGLIDYGVSLRAGFLTEAGWLLLAREAGCEERVREWFAASRHREAQSHVERVYQRVLSVMEALP